MARPDRITELEKQIIEHAESAAGAIIRRDFSLAATECHRAHQKTLIIRELDQDRLLRGDSRG